MKLPKPIRVAMVHYRDAAIAGGSLRVGETIANNLDPARVSAELVFAYGGPGPVAKRARVPCHFIESRGPKDLSAWPRARALFRRLQPDIIHFQEGVVWLRTALLGTPARKIVHIHGRYSSAEVRGKEAPRNARSILDERVLQAYLKFTDAQVCINHATRNWLLDLGWIHPEGSCVVSNAIDVLRFSARMPTADARSQLDLPQDALLLGFVGRLVWEKGCADFLSLIDQLPERWHGVICGDGPLKDELRRECEQRGITKRIHFLGMQDDVSIVYSAIDAYAFVSKFEAFGLAVSEAMAAGVPVFGLEREGDYDEAEYPLLTPATGVMISCDPANTAAGIAELARRVLDYGEHPERYQFLIENARLWVNACFAAPIQAEAMTRVYEDIFAQAKPSQSELARFYEARREEAEGLVATASSKQFVAATA